MKKRLICICLCLCILFLVLPTLPFQASAYYFTDVTRTGSDTAEYFNAIMWMADNGYMVGTTSTTFSPESNLTRAMFVTVLYAYSGRPSVAGYPNPFSDVSSTDYFYDPVRWAYHFGITSGTTATTFSPHTNITFAMGVTMLKGYTQNYLNSAITNLESASNIPGYSSLPGFAQYSIRWAVGNGLIKTNGMSAADFAYKMTHEVARKEFALLINRLHTNVEGIIIGENHFSFFNVSSGTSSPPLSPNFRSSYYNRTMISDLHYQRLQSKFDADDWSRIYYAFFIPGNTEWKGACHGMCLAIIADMTGLSNFDKMYTQEDSSMYDVPVPADCFSYPNKYTTDLEGTYISWSESAISYLHVLQIGYAPTYGGIVQPGRNQSQSNVYTEYGGRINNENLPSSTEAFHDYAKYSGIMLLNLSMHSTRNTVSHSVILVGPPDKSESGYIKYKIYDPQIVYGTGGSAQNSLSIIKFPSPITSMSDIMLSSAPGYQITEIKYLYNLSFLDQYDIDGPYNNIP